jgi:small multidrug resistance family-3 protein
VSRVFAVLILLACACLEAGGDALARGGMHARSTGARVARYIAAAAVLFACGWLVNRPPWSFGSLLGVYVVLFFVVAQAIGWVAFGEKPGSHILMGGALIVAGGIAIAARS